mmetsp:Transcript_28202/g.81102  ORF Transcript_28202/g.81102 Transcript_28202/m.81102 type:complete len:425 (+) Transcript_28202:60-1334(+)
MALASTRSHQDHVKAMASNVEVNFSGNIAKGPKFCRCCFYRRFKRGKLASIVLVPRRSLRVWLDFAAHVHVVWDLMMVPDTFLVLVSSFASVFIFEEYLSHLAVSLNWTAVSLMLAFPLQNAIKEAYKRRETALMSLVDFRATALNVYLANSVWDWPGADTFNGREEDNRPVDQGGKGMKKKPCNIALPVDHSDRVRQMLLRLFDAVQETLLIPRAGHARMEYRCGHRELGQVEFALESGRKEILRLLGRLHRAVEDLKAAGMPANEASRINQYNMFLARDFERLWAAKVYYTPIALRAMLRVVIQLLPFAYGPYWLYVARGMSGERSPAALGFALAFSSFISLLLIAMVNLEEQMENPFRHANRDSIRVKQEMDLARQSIRIIDEDMGTRWQDDITFDWEIVGDSDESEEDSAYETSAMSPHF